MWVYRAVVLRWLWPSRTWMVRTSAPASSRWVAKLWRNEWGLMCLVRPEARTAALQIRWTAEWEMGRSGPRPGNR